jgi:hypothetical protein
LLVERLIGRYAGTRANMPFHIAERAIKTGAVRPVDAPEVISRKVEPELEAGQIPKKRWGRLRKVRR